MTEYIDFNKVIQFSKNNCFQRSQSLCATYVKKAFEAGGCEYISGNGWDNQKFCMENGFKCIGDFYPIDNNPRPHKNIPIQFPAGYIQQIGDICLIKHGLYGHIVYATGPNINDWVSDFWQRYPGQQNNMGPYCYNDYNYERVQFWRHSSVMNNTPEILPIVESIKNDIYKNNPNPNPKPILNNSNRSGVVKDFVQKNDNPPISGILLGANNNQI